jgi:hypothetical protein
MPLTETAALDQKMAMDQFTKLMASFTPDQLKVMQRLSLQSRQFF